VNSVSVPIVPIAPAAPAISRLVSLSLNTTQFNHPCIKFEFSTNVIPTIVETAEGTSLIISFQLFKLCRDESTPVTIGGLHVITRPVSVSDIVWFHRL